MASGGFMFVRAGVTIHCIFTSLGGKPTPDLDSFQAAIESFPDGARSVLRALTCEGPLPAALSSYRLLTPPLPSVRTSLTFFGLTDRNRMRTAVITIDRKWFVAGRSRRCDPDWDFVPARDPPPRPGLETQSLEEAQGAKRARATSKTSCPGEGEVGEVVEDGAQEACVTEQEEETAGGLELGAPVGETPSSCPTLHDALVMVSFDVP